MLSRDLSFAGHAAPARAEVTRFRPNLAKKGSVAARFVNHSNKSIQAFSFDLVCVDAAGNKVDTVRTAWSFGSPDLVIEPGGTFEFTKDVPSMNESASSANFVARELTFVRGEKWAPARKQND